MNTSTLVSAILGGFISWWLTKHYYLKANVALQKSIEQLTRKLLPKETLEEFERLLETGDWEENYEGSEPVFICKSHPTFQFTKVGERDTFFEDWMEVFPDKNGMVYDLSLKIKGTTIKTLKFISADGGRYTLPMPEIHYIDDKQVFTWKENSIGYRVAEVIGHFYHCKTLKEVGKFTGVEVYYEQRLT